MSLLQKLTNKIFKSSMYSRIDRFGERIAAKLVSIIFIKPTAEQQKETKFQDICLINVTKNRYAYTKKHKMFRFFYYESVKYCSTEPAFAIVYNKKINPNKYLFNFGKPIAKPVSSTIQSMPHKTNYRTSYRHLRQLFNNQSIYNKLFSRLKASNSSIFNPVILLISKVQFIKKINGLAKLWFTAKTSSEMTALAIDSTKKSNNIKKLFEHSIGIFHVVGKKYTKIIAYIQIYVNNILEYIQTNVVALLTNKKLKNIMIDRITLFNPEHSNIKYTLIEQLHGVITDVQPIHNKLQVQARLNNKNVKVAYIIGMVMNKNHSYELLLDAQISGYLEYFYVYSDQLYAQRKLYEVLPPVYTYRIFHMCTLMSFGKYYLSIYTGKYVGAQINDPLYNSKQNNNSIYYYFNKFHYLLKKKEHYYFKEYCSSKKLLYNFLTTNLKMLDYSLGIYKVISANNFYYPIALQDILLDQHTKITDNQNKLFKDSFTLSEIVRTEYGFDKAQASNKNIHRHYRTKMFGIKNTLVTTDNQLFKGLSGGIKSSDLKKIFSNNKALSRIMYSNIVNNQVKEIIRDRYYMRAKSIYSNIITSKNIHKLNLKKKIVDQRKRSAAEYQTAALEKRIYIYTAYHLLSNRKNPPEKDTTPSRIDLINKFIINKILIPITLYTSHIKTTNYHSFTILAIQVEKLKKCIYYTTLVDFNKNINSLYEFTHEMLCILRNIYELIKLVDCSQLVQNNILNNIYHVYKLISTIQLKIPTFINNKIDFNWIFSNTQLHTKINKIKFFRKKAKLTIKYIRYSSIYNSLTIYSTNAQSMLFDAASCILYSKSRNTNNKFNEITKIDNLLFRKLIVQLQTDYPINRWLTFKDLVLDLISNYRTIHADSTVYEHQEDCKTSNKQDWQTIANYLSEGHHPYSRNLLRTNFLNHGVQMINIGFNAGFKTHAERGIFWNIVQLHNKRFEADWLFSYDGTFVGEQFESLQLVPMPEYTNPKMQQHLADVVARDIILWDIPSNKSYSIYEPSYFTNKLYYLDYLDYILYKYVISEIYVDNKIKKLLNVTNFPVVHAIDQDLLSKFSWDINSYDLKYIIPLYDPQYKYIPYGLNKFKRKIAHSDRNEISMHDYITNSITNSQIDPIPFQFTTLRWMVAHNKKILRAEQQNKGLFVRLQYKLNARTESIVQDRMRNILALFDNSISTLTAKTKKTHHQPLLITPKIKSVNKVGIYNLSILPNYLQSQLNKEIYLYRKKISELLEFEEAERIHVVETKRFIRSIINTNLLVSSYELLSNYEVCQEAKYLKIIQLYQRNIRYYNQIILQYSIHVLERTSRFLHGAVNSGYEWDHLTSDLYFNGTEKSNKQPTIGNYYTIYSDPQHDRPYKYTLYTRVPFDEEYTSDVSIISEIVSWCNTQVFDIIYTGNHYDIASTNYSQLDVLSMYKIQLLLMEYRRKINKYLKLQSGKMRKINNLLNKLQLKPAQYLKYSFKLLQCSMKQLSEEHFAKISLSFMLLYISGLPFIKKYYNFISNNLIKNIDLASIPYRYKWKFNTYDSNIFKQTMYKLGSYMETKSWLTTNTYNQFIQSYLQQPNTGEEAYYKLANLHFERRFIWYITKSLHSNAAISAAGLNKYQIIYKSLLTKNKLTNTKLSLCNLEKIARYYTAIDRLATIANNVPILYSTLYNTVLKQLYSQTEPILSGYRTSTALYYKPIPFELIEINHEPFLIYIGLKALYKWKTYVHFITYPIKTQNKNLCQFVRFKLYDINLNTRKQRLLSKYGTFITELTLLHINYIKKNHVKTTKYMFSKLGKTPFTAIYNKMNNLGRLEVYFAFIKYHTGVLYYLPNLIANNADRTNLMKVLNIYDDDSMYLQYFGYYFLNDENMVFMHDDVYYTQESDAEAFYLIGLGFDETMLGQAEITVHYWDNSVELENNLLLAYLNSLLIKNDRINKNRYTVKSASNFYPLVQILFSEPSNALLLVFGLLLLDTDSTSLLVFNTEKHPTNQDIWSWIYKFPLINMDGEEDEGEIGITMDEHSAYYFRVMFNPQEYNNGLDESDYITNTRYGLGNVHRAVLVEETEPLAPLGLEINISPLFRIFTYSGARIWNERLKALLLLQQRGFWNINYMADTQVFENIFKGNIKVGINASTVDAIKDSFKNFNFIEESMPAYIQKYHQANNISDFRKWLEMYFYGLLEYQRLVPDSYDKLFTQPSIRAFLYYNFINDKEYELVNKRALRHLAGRVYSLQRDPTQQEEFFLYPNKRVQPVQLAQRRRALKYYDFSVPKNKYSYPRTGYEAYPYSYAQNMWYFHHALVNNPKIYTKIYNNHLVFFEKGESLIDYYIRFRHYIRMQTRQILYKYIRHYGKEFIGPRRTALFPLWHKLYSETYKHHYAEMALAYKYGIRFRLNRFFTTNTIKLNDLNLLYKPIKQTTGAHAIVSYSLHPKIRNKYSLNTHNTHNLTSNIRVFPKQKVTNMVLLLHQQANTNMTLHQILKHNPAVPDIAGITYAYRGISKSVLTSNGISHEKPYGMLWSIYNRPSIDINLARNTASLGIMHDMSAFALNSIHAQNRTGIHAVLSLERDGKESDPQYRFGGSIPIINETRLMEFNQTYYCGQSGIAGYINDFMDIDGEFHTDPQFTSPHSGWHFMPALHGLYIPQSTFSLRNFTSYIPIQFSLATKDLLNSTYLTTQDWYNPTFYASFVTRHFDNHPFGRRFLHHIRSYRTRNRALRRIITSNVYDNIEHTNLSEQEDLAMKFFGPWQNYVVSLLNSREQTIGRIIKKTDYITKENMGISGYPLMALNGTEPKVIRQINKNFTKFMDRIAIFAWNTNRQSTSDRDPHNMFDSKRTESLDLFFFEYPHELDLSRIEETMVLMNKPTRKITTKFGVHKRMDLTNPVLRTLMPNKIYNQVTHDLNSAYIYINRNNFINIYEHFRIEPFLYKHTEPIDNNIQKFKYMPHTFNKINDLYKTTLRTANKIIYPLESQYSSDRRTTSLVVLDFNSKYKVQNRNHLRLLAPVALHRRFIRTWPAKYGRYYTSSKYFGIKPRKSFVYKLADILNVKYYNMYKQATYYKPTKNFFPSAYLSSYSRILNLREGEMKLHRKPHSDKLLTNENFYRYANFPKDLIEAYLRARYTPKKEIYSHTQLSLRAYRHKHKIKHKRKKRRKMMAKLHEKYGEEAQSVPPYNARFNKHFYRKRFHHGIPRYHRRKRSGQSTLAFTDRFSNTRSRRQLYRQIFNLEVIHKYGRPRRTLNLGRDAMEMVVRQYSTQFPSDLRVINKRMDNRIHLWKRHHASPKEILHIISAIPWKERKIIGKALFRRNDYKQYAKAMQPYQKITWWNADGYYESRHWLEVTFADQTGHLFEKVKIEEVPTIKNLPPNLTYQHLLNIPTNNISYKNMEPIQSDTMYAFGNIISGPLTTPFRAEPKTGFISSDSLVRIIKPKKYSKDIPKLQETALSLLLHKQNKFANNMYNSAFTQPIRKLVRKPSILNRYRHIRGTRYLRGKAYADKLVFYRDIFIKGHKEFNRGTSSIVHRDSYWQYKANKQLEYSSKFKTNEFITTRVNPSKMLERYPDDVDRIYKPNLRDYIHVRGTFSEKQFIYNYNVQNSKYVLPLVEYFYYTQFSKDNTNILSIHKFHILHKDTPAILEDQVIRISPFVQKRKSINNKYINQINTSDPHIDKIERILVENSDFNNLTDVYQHNIIAYNKETIYDSYIFVNSFSRPIVHWFVKIYYNNIHYFDAFYSWCCDNLSNIIIF